MKTTETLALANRAYDLAEHLREQAEGVRLHVEKGHDEVAQKFAAELQAGAAHLHVVSVQVARSIGTGGSSEHVQ
jgi:hypothetical protein